MKFLHITVIQMSHSQMDVNHWSLRLILKDSLVIRDQPNLLSPLESNIVRMKQAVASLLEFPD